MTNELISDIAEKKEETMESGPESRLQAAYKAGLQWGRVRRSTHPKMLTYISATKGEIQVVDLNQFLQALDVAKEFLKQLALRGDASVLLVGIQPAARALVAEYAKKMGFPYVNERWLGGTMTNFKTLVSRIQYLKELEQKINAEEFASYTKKERFMMQKEVTELRKKFEGLRNMSKTPDAIVLFGLKRHDGALREAKRMKIPVIALVNTNDDPSQVKYPIPGNDNSAQGISFVLQEIERAWAGSQKLENRN